MKKRATAFHAELKNNIQNLPHNNKVVFDKIHLNEGSAYDPKTGIFTCKDPGIYVFDWTIMTHPGNRFDTAFMVDGVIQGRLHLDARSIKKYRSGSNMVVARLAPGNKVWVEPHSTDVGQYATGSWCFFSGFKIWWLSLYIKISININIYTSSVFCCDEHRKILTSIFPWSRIRDVWDGLSGGCFEYRPDAY